MLSVLQEFWCPLLRCWFDLNYNESVEELSKVKLLALLVMSQLENCGLFWFAFLLNPINLISDYLKQLNFVDETEYLVFSLGVICFRYTLLYSTVVCEWVFVWVHCHGGADLCLASGVSRATTDVVGVARACRMCVLKTALWHANIADGSNCIVLLAMLLILSLHSRSTNCRKTLARMAILRSL